MSEANLRPGRLLGTFTRLYPDAWKQVDDLRANRKGLGDWPDWCFLPLAGAYAIISKGARTLSLDPSRHVGILGALAAWRVTQGIYRFDPTILDALWDTPVTGDIPTEVLFHLPEWCVYIPTPERRWHGAALHGVFAHLEYDVNDKRTELRFVLDVTGPGGDDPIVLPLHVGQGGVAEGVAAMMRECARHTPVSVQMPDGLAGELTDDVSPLVSLVLYLCSQAAEIRAAGGGDRRPARPQPVRTKKGVRLFPPDHPMPWEVGYRLGVALRRAVSEAMPTPGMSGTQASPRPHIRRAHWHSYWIGRRDQPEARSVMLKWLPPIPVNVQDVEDLAPTVRGVADPP
jgi:hypothetical protein